MKIIAEVGSNWKHLEDCLHSIGVAHKCGAHAVKFQMFTEKELYGTDTGKWTYGLTPCLPLEWVPKLYEHAKETEIEFMCTGFSAQGYKFLDKFVERHKIASAELTDESILKTVNEFKKPVILSTAGSTHDEIEKALKLLDKCPVTIMYCVGDYPAKVVDFRQVADFKDYFGKNYSYGYSDHSLDVLNIPLMAKKIGCSVIEKHVNFTDYTDTNDATHALNAKEFNLMCRVIMEQYPSLMETDTESSKNMRAIYKRRFNKELNGFFRAR